MIRDILRSLSPLSALQLALFFVVLLVALAVAFEFCPRSWRELMPRALANDLREWRAQRALAARRRVWHRDQLQRERVRRERERMETERTERIARLRAEHEAVIRSPFADPARILDRDPRLGA